jgi:monoamine oxidase
VIVVGGGIAGLLTAYELQKRGITSHVLEATDVWGGRIATADYGDGLRAEYGLQEIWEHNPLIGVARELGLELEGEVVEAFSSVLIDGQRYSWIQDTADEYFASFLSPDEVKALKGWLEKAKRLFEVATKEGVANAEIKKLQNLAFGAWVKKDNLPRKVVKRT